MVRLPSLAAVAALVVMLSGVAGDSPATQGGPFPEWENGLPADPAHFPIGVWLQNERFLHDYRDMGINLYIGLGGWRTQQEQLAYLRQHNMPVIAHQNNTMRSLLVQNSSLLDPVVAWMQQDEPDNAQSDGQGGWGPPVTPEEIQSRYEAFQSHDPTRPIYMNLGQGVAWDGWIGRGVRTNRPEDYPEYQKGADILSFDIYPAASTRPQTQGQLWRVGYGVKRLREWTDDDKPVWNIIEASRIGGAGMVTPHEIRALAWMSIVHGSTGIGYFVHEWDSDGNLVSTHSLRGNDVLRPAVTAVNHQIHELAPVINSPTLHDRVNVISGNTADTIATNYGVDGIATMLKSDGEDGYYLFTVRMRETSALGTFQILDMVGRGGEAHVLGEDRMIPIDADGMFSETYDGWDTKLYHIVPEPTSATLLAAGAGLLLMRRRGRA